jgi:DNA repair protein RecO (recombination protein O)
MFIETEGVILRQIKTMDNRKMVLLFSKNYGKISAGSNISEKGRSKSSLAMKPFTFGRYELFKGRDIYNINSAEVLKSYYKIGEDVEKYMCCSYALEFTEKMLPENSAAPKIFDLLIEFLSMVERRSSKYLSLVVAYQLKMMQYSGTAPHLTSCICCNDKDSTGYFSISDGGVLCNSCYLKAESRTNNKDALLYEVNFGILNVMQFILDHPISSFEKLAIDDNNLAGLQEILRRYAGYHYDIGDLKSEGFLAK